MPLFACGGNLMLHYKYIEISLTLLKKLSFCLFEQHKKLEIFAM